MPKITKETNIAEIVEKYPAAIEVFKKYNLFCFGCSAAHFENLEAISQEFGVNIDKFVKELNEAIEK
ncbi:MAG: protein of unknown function (DUF1858) [Parcubacteria group bacterium Athens0714_12]|nr:MAG: protein of unknown function (DUF1858) [Parcubacteria group bacterium Athens0714_12]